MTTALPVTFETQLTKFAHYGQFPKKKNQISFKNFDKWLKQAKLYDKFLYPELVEEYFKKNVNSRNMLEFEKVNRCLEHLAEYKRTNSNKFKAILTKCGNPLDIPISEKDIKHVDNKQFFDTFLKFSQNPIPMKEENASITSANLQNWFKETNVWNYFESQRVFESNVTKFSDRDRNISFKDMDNFLLFILKGKGVTLEEFKGHLIKPILQKIQEPESIDQKNFEKTFDLFSRYRNSMSSGKEMTLLNFEIWLKQANIFGTLITNEVVKAAFPKWTKSKSVIFLNDFDSFLTALITKKDLTLPEFKEILAKAKIPGSSQSSIKSGSKEELDDPEFRLRTLFEAFSKYKKPKNTGREIDFENIEVWLEVSGLLNTVVTRSEAKKSYKKIALSQRAINYMKFEYMIISLVEGKMMTVAEFKDHLSKCKIPHATAEVGVKRKRANEDHESDFEKVFDRFSHHDNPAGIGKLLSYTDLDLWLTQAKMYGVVFSCKEVESAFKTFTKATNIYPLKEKKMIKLEEFDKFARQLIQGKNISLDELKKNLVKIKNSKFKVEDIQSYCYPQSDIKKKFIEYAKFGNLANSGDDISLFNFELWIRNSNLNFSFSMDRIRTAFNKIAKTRRNVPYRDLDLLIIEIARGKRITGTEVKNQLIRCKSPISIPEKKRLLEKEFQIELNHRSKKTGTGTSIEGEMPLFDIDKWFVEARIYDSNFTLVEVEAVFKQLANTNYKLFKRDFDNFLKLLLEKKNMNEIQFKEMLTSVKKI